MAYGAAVDSDILAKNLPRHAVGTQIARICLLLKSFVHYPVVHFPARLCLLDMWLAMKLRYFSNEGRGGVIPMRSQLTGLSADFRRPFHQDESGERSSIASASGQVNGGQVNTAAISRESAALSCSMNPYVTKLECGGDMSLRLPETGRYSLPIRMRETMKQQFASHLVTQTNVFRAKHLAMRGQLVGSHLGATEVRELTNALTSNNFERFGTQCPDQATSSFADSTHNILQYSEGRSSQPQQGRSSLVSQINSGRTLEQYQHSVALKMQLGVRNRLTQLEFEEVLLRNNVRAAGGSMNLSNIGGSVSSRFRPAADDSRRICLAASANLGSQTLNPGNSGGLKFLAAVTSFKHLEEPVRQDPSMENGAQNKVLEQGLEQASCQEPEIEAGCVASSDASCASSSPATVTQTNNSAANKHSSNPSVSVSSGVALRIDLVSASCSHGSMAPCSVADRPGARPDSIAIFLPSSTFDGLHAHDEMVIDLEKTTEAEFRTITILFLVFSWAATILFTNLGSLIDMVSALFGVPQVYLYPGLAWIQLQRLNGHFDAQYPEAILGEEEAPTDETSNRETPTQGAGSSRAEMREPLFGDTPVPRKLALKQCLTTYMAGGSLVVFGCFISLSSVTLQILQLCN